MVGKGEARSASWLDSGQARPWPLAAQAGSSSSPSMPGLERTEIEPVTPACTAEPGVGGRQPSPAFAMRAPVNVEFGGGKVRLLADYVSRKIGTSGKRQGALITQAQVKFLKRPFSRLLSGTL